MQSPPWSLDGLRVECVVRAGRFEVSSCVESDDGGPGETAMHCSGTLASDDSGVWQHIDHAGSELIFPFAFFMFHYKKSTSYSTTHIP